MPSPLLPDAVAPDRFAFAPMLPRPAMGQLPLQAVTLLAVEDSRFACDALRLLSQRSGARLRRAGTLEHADAHLRVYRPDVVLVDLGLPDGRGEGLIRRLAGSGPGRPKLLGMSGDPDGRPSALAAGADAFLDKPLAGLAGFQRAILGLLPEHAGAFADWPAEGEVTADPAALHDDLSQVAAAVGRGPGADERRYLAGFIMGLAGQTHDAALRAEMAVLRNPDAELDSLVRLIRERMAGSAPLRRGAL